MISAPQPASGQIATITKALTSSLQNQFGWTTERITASFTLPDRIMTSMEVMVLVSDGAGIIHDFVYEKLGQVMIERNILGVNNLTLTIEFDFQSDTYRVHVTAMAIFGHPYLITNRIKGEATRMAYDIVGNLIAPHSETKHRSITLPFPRS